MRKDRGHVYAIRRIDVKCFLIQTVTTYYLDLDLVPPVLIRTVGDELSPSGTIVGCISRPIPINTQFVQILIQCVLPCPLWSSDPPPAAFWSPYYGQTSWSGCRESQDVLNKSSSSCTTVSCSAACPVRAITSSFAIWSRHEMPKMLLRHRRWKHQQCTKYSVGFLLMVSEEICYSFIHYYIEAAGRTTQNREIEIKHT